MTRASTALVLVYGPAGSGKTTLTWKFCEWCCRHAEWKVASVNFDPAVINLPYKPIFDIRNYVTAKEIMEKYNLGPNGGIIRAVEESKKYLNKLYNALEEASYDYVFIDTPGIMEVFIGRETGREIIDELLKRYDVFGLFIMDASIITRPSEYVYFKNLYVLSGLKLGIPSIPVWNKVSSATQVFKQVDQLNADKLIDALTLEPGLYTDAAIELVKLIHKLESAVRFLKVDALTYKGFEDICAALSEVYCTCGDLT